MLAHHDGKVLLFIRQAKSCVIGPLSSPLTQLSAFQDQWAFQGFSSSESFVLPLDERVSLFTQQRRQNR